MVQPVLKNIQKENKIRIKRSKALNLEPPYNIVESYLKRFFFFKNWQQIVQNILFQWTFLFQLGTSSNGLL